MLDVQVLGLNSLVIYLFMAFLNTMLFTFTHCHRFFLCILMGKHLLEELSVISLFY